jgi:hypothetical protein
MRLQLMCARRSRGAQAAQTSRVNRSDFGSSGTLGGSVSALLAGALPGAWPPFFGLGPSCLMWLGLIRQSFAMVIPRGSRSTCNHLLLVSV